MWSRTNDQNSTRATHCLRDRRGATAVEYGVMIALIAVVIIAAVAMLGRNLNDVFSSIALCIESKLQNPGQGDPNVPPEAACKGARGGGNEN